MKRMNTDHLLTLGMALITDRRAMERRVRGVFARKKSAKGVIALSLVLALALGFGAFTTACQPGQATVSDSNAQLATGGDALVSGGDAIVSGGDAMVSGGDALASGGDALASGGDATASSQEFTKEAAMKNLSRDLELARKLVVPHIESIVFTQRGTWEIQKNPDAAQLRTAAEHFLQIANEIFTKTYTPDDLKTIYYVDKTGFRSDVWRFDSKDGVLSGALDAKTLAFLSADCLNEPADAMHPSIKDGDKLDVGAAAERIAKILGGMAYSFDWRSGYSMDGATNGWMMKRVVFFPLGDGRYCAISVFGDVNLTPTTVCVYPDEDCGDENVFWRADLEWVEGAAKLLYPQDFRKGEPRADDMKQETAVAFFNKLIEVAGFSELVASETVQAPTATFMVDHSGVRENYWLIEGNGISLELTSKTGRMLSLTANSRLGSKLKLGDIPYEKMGEKEYEEATKKLFVALFGKDAVQSVSVNAVYDYHYCTMDPQMADGTEYEIMFQDGLIVEVTSLYKIDPNTWPSVPEWLEKWTSVDEATGEISITGFENGTWKIVPNWLADWVYVNNETGEIFAMEW